MQFVAEPAAAGFLGFLKNLSDPVEVMVAGRCAVWSPYGAGEHRSHSRKSISWHDLVIKDGAVVDSLRQFPLGRRSAQILLNGKWASYLT